MMADPRLEPTVPMLSIVMPVFNTGRLLLDSVRSIVAQTLFADEPEGSWELLIVDDASTDADTIAALEEACRLSPAIRLMQNHRTRGAAGARNTGIFAARGVRVGFLDSDDLLYPDFLARMESAFAGHRDALWRAAHFDVGDEAGRSTPSPLSRRSPCLYGHIEEDYLAGRVSILHRPVDVLLRCGCIQVMTVQVERTLLLSFGGFDETLPSAEDYDLWVRIANRQDLYLAPLDAGIYRLRSGSLTRSGRPMYYCEDRMLLAAKSDAAFASFSKDIDDRLRKVYSTFCFHYRAHRQFAIAARYALRLIGLGPMRLDGWRHLVAVAVRR